MGHSQQTQLATGLNTYQANLALTLVCLVLVALGLPPPPLLSSTNTSGYQIGVTCPLLFTILFTVLPYLQPYRVITR